MSRGNVVDVKEIGRSGQVYASTPVQVRSLSGGRRVLIDVLRGDVVPICGPLVFCRMREQADIRTGSGLMTFVATKARYLTKGLVMARPVAVLTDILTWQDENLVSRDLYLYQFLKIPKEINDIDMRLKRNVRSLCYIDADDVNEESGPSPSSILGSEMNIKTSIL